MAVIGKLRSLNYLVVGLIAMALILFLLMDIIPNFNLMKQDDASNIGVVNGEKISYEAFNAKYEESEKLAMTQNGGQPLPEAQQHYLKSQIWNQMSSELLNKKVFSCLGLDISPGEVKEMMMGENGDPSFKSAPAFSNNGVFDPAKVAMYVQNLDNDDPGTPPGSKRAQWMAYEKSIKEERAKAKFNNLISKAAYVPKWQAEMEYVNQAKTFDVNYVIVPYTAINDKDVKMDDSKLTAYFEKNKAKFYQPRSTRKVKFGVFNLFPSSQDTQSVFAKISEIKQEFINAPNDSLFLKAYSDNGFDGSYSKKEEIKSNSRDTIFRIPTGSLIGPFIDGENYSIAKVLDRKMLADSVRVSVITIPTGDLKTDADKQRVLALIDSVYRMVDTVKMDFATAAMMYSSDPASKATGGDIGMIYKMQNEWNPDIFNRGANGKIFKSFNQNSAKIVKITSYNGTIPAVKYGLISVPLIASKETQTAIYGAASEFSGRSKDLKTMEAEAIKANVVLQEAEFSTEDYNIGQIQDNCKETIKWAFDHKEGDISPVQSAGNKKYIVALISGGKDKGNPQFAQVKKDIEVEYMREAKAEVITEKIKNAKTLAEVATAYSVSPQAAPGVSFGQPVLNGVYEPAVGGVLFNLKANEVSKAIKGYSGVVLVQPTRIGEVKVEGADLTMIKMQTLQRAKQKQGILESLSRNADIKDNRIKILN